MDHPIIDLHCHPLLPAFVAAVDKAHFGAMPMPAWSVDEQLAMMGRHGIETAATSSAVHPGLNDDAKRRIASKKRASPVPPVPRRSVMTSR